MSIASRRHTRRTTLAVGASLLASTVSAGHFRSVAAQATPVPASSGDGVQLLFVQSFGASRLDPDPADSSQWILTLSDGTGHTLYFSDRPGRLAGTIPTDRFVSVFASQTVEDPANAALVAQTADDAEVTHAFELLGLAYDAQAGVATYTVRFLSDPSALEITFRQPPLQTLSEPVAYGQSEVFIDSGFFMQIVAYGSDPDDD